LLSEHFSGVHDKASTDAEALLRLGSHLALPRGWRNSFSIQTSQWTQRVWACNVPLLSKTPNALTCKDP